MFNPYVITLSLFVVAGLLVTIRSWLNITKARKRLKWPTVEGIIKESNRESIVFSYTVEEQTYTNTMDFQLELSPELKSNNTHQNKYPQGDKVTIFYEPGNPENGTIEPETGNDNWLIFLLGLGASLLGLGFLFFN